MNIISPPTIINKGIALYSPYQASIKEDSSLRLEIFYSTTNPALSIISCSNSEVKLWEITRPQSRTGLLFIYDIVTTLDLGFYTLRLSTVNRDKSGQMTIGVLRPTNKIIIGLPYSIYGPIEIV